MWMSTHINKHGIWWYSLNLRDIEKRRFIWAASSTNDCSPSQDVEQSPSSIHCNYYSHDLCIPSLGIRGKTHESIHPHVRKCNMSHILIVLHCYQYRAHDCSWLFRSPHPCIHLRRCSNLHNKLHRSIGISSSRHQAYSQSSNRIHSFHLNCAQFLKYEFKSFTTYSTGYIDLERHTHHFFIVLQTPQDWVKHLPLQIATSLQLSQ